MQQGKTTKISWCFVSNMIEKIIMFSERALQNFSKLRFTTGFLEIVKGDETEVALSEVTNHYYNDNSHVYLPTFTI